MGRSRMDDEARKRRLAMRMVVAALEKREREAAYQRARAKEKRDPATLPGPVRTLSKEEREAYARTLLGRR